MDAASEAEQQTVQNSATAEVRADESCKCTSCTVARLCIRSFNHTSICALIHCFTRKSCVWLCTRHTRCQGQGVVPHLDLLEGVFRLIQVLKREAHLVVQLSQPPVICLHRIRPRQVAIARCGCTQVGTGTEYVTKR